MLTSLRVRDLAVLEDVEVAFGAGLTVLTGETGAGKSLLVDALSLLSGERADGSLVRTGAEKLVVEGVFESDDAAVRVTLVEAGLAEDGTGPTELAVRREVAAGGKGRLFLDGSPAALRTLVELAPRLLVLYGQAEARELLDPSVPRQLLDRFAGLADAVAEVEGLFAEYQARKADRERIEGAAGDRQRRLDLLEFQVKEIDEVKPVAGEEDVLAAERLALSTVERRGRLLSEASVALESDDGGALGALTAARKALLALAELDPAAAPRAAEAVELATRAADLAAETARDLDRLEADPERLGAVAERLDALAKLKRKYGPTLADVLAHRAAVGRERDELVDLEGTLAKARKAEDGAFGAYREKALQLSAARSAAAPALSKGTEKHLRDLAFLKASFRVEVSRRPDPEGPFVAGGERIAFGPQGVDQVGLAFAPNPGEAARPLAKIASGGELSRIQLALAAALAEGEAAEARRAPGASRRSIGRTFVFDEVDAGVSGATAEAVARKLRALAAREQVLVVTHLPQVAAAGEKHLSVSKEAAGGRTRTRVVDLDSRGRVEAVAAMLAGATVTDAARAQARQLLEAFRTPA